MSDTVVGLILIAVGVLTMFGSALNWRIVTHPGKLLNILVGDKAARVIAFLVGAMAFFLGIGELIGVDWIP